MVKANKEWDKFVVFKKEELDMVFDRTPALREYFETIQHLIKLNRVNHNKKAVNKYIVCNQDEPYAEKVWRVILQGEDDKEGKE